MCVRGAEDALPETLWPQADPGPGSAGPETTLGNQTVPGAAVLKLWFPDPFSH